MLQKTTYLLLIKSSLLDAGGNTVGSSTPFKTCLAAETDYCGDLSAALKHAGLKAGDIIGASLFTTMSVTSWMEDAFRFVDQTELGIATPAGLPYIFDTSAIGSFIWNPGQSALAPQAIPVQTALADVGKVAFGFYFSPNYLNTSGASAGLITTAGNQPVPVNANGLTTAFVPVSFHVFLPKQPPPSSGYPVVIYGHGLGDSQFGAPSYIASTLARNGFATVAMEITGHGYGPGSTVTIVDASGQPHQISTPGRGVLLPGSPTIGASDGCILPGAFGVRDCGRQTAVDVYALIKTIQRSGGLLLGLNPNKISYVGQSFGSIYGTILQAVTPDLDAAVMNGGGGPFVDVARLALNGRPLGQSYLSSLHLLNATGESGIAPKQPFGDDFNDNYVYRDVPVVTNSVPGALQIQAAFESAEWLGMLGDAASYAPYLQRAPLPGNSPATTLLQFGISDLEVPNPANVTYLKAAGAQKQTTVFEFPLVASDLLGVSDPAYLPGFPILPHRILSNPTIFNVPKETPISLAEQQGTAAFLLSGGKSIPDTNLFLSGPSVGQKLFVNDSAIPTGLNYLIPPFLTMP